MDAGLTELLGYAAAGLVLITFSVRSISALRSVAIASNLMFIAYAVAQDLLPVLALHTMLLPLNVWRLCEAVAATAGSRRQHGEWRRQAIRPVGRVARRRRLSGRGLAGLPSRRTALRAT